MNAIEVCVRAAHLLGLAVVPTGLSPDPPVPASGSAAAASLAIFAAVLAGAWLFRRSTTGPMGTVSAALALVSLATAVVAAIVVGGRDVPLGRGVPFVAVAVWLTLATTASTAAGEWLGSNWKHKRMAGVVLVLGLAAVQLQGAAELLRSDEAMWAAAARREPGHERAVGKLGAIYLATKRAPEAKKLAERCLSSQPASCTCAELAAEAGARAGTRDRRPRAEAAAQACPERWGPLVLLAEALTASSDAEAALARLDEAERLGGDPRRVEHARALALAKLNRPAEALAAAERAVAAGAGRDAKTALAAARIGAGQLDAAEATIAALERDEPNDPAVAFQRAVLADRRGDASGAKKAYLAVLRIDPKHADARHEIALAAYRSGDHDDAKQHARRFAQDNPGDPRVQPLLAAVGASSR